MTNLQWIAIIVTLMLVGCKNTTTTARITIEKDWNRSQSEFVTRAEIEIK